MNISLVACKFRFLNKWFVDWNSWQSKTKLAWLTQKHYLSWDTLFLYFSKGRLSDIDPELPSAELCLGSLFLFCLFRWVNFPNPNSLYILALHVSGADDTTKGFVKNALALKRLMNFLSWLFIHNELLLGCSTFLLILSITTLLLRENLFSLVDSDFLIAIPY